jgi:cytochrome c biogenesis protein CcdA
LRLLWLDIWIVRQSGLWIANQIGVMSKTSLAYWTAGLLVILGASKLMATVIGDAGFSFPEPYIYTIQFLIGLALSIAGFKLKTSAPADRGKRPKNLTLNRTFLLGMAMTILEFPTALPYLAAIEQIAKAKLDLLTIAGLLALVKRPCSH